MRIIRNKFDALNHKYIVNNIQSNFNAFKRFYDDNDKIRYDMLLDQLIKITTEFIGYGLLFNQTKDIKRDE